MSDTNPPNPDTPDQATMDEIRKRMVESGEWDRIYRLLKNELEENGFVDDLKNFAKETARQQEQPRLDSVLQVVLPKAQTMLQPTVRSAVTQEIEAVVERMVEDA